jgi:hypothetical protein
MKRIIQSCAAIVFALAVALVGSRADEGMWVFNNLPTDYLKAQYGFEPDAEWADHLMKSCVRFNVGGSASFISSTGLVLTNHHVGRDTLHKLSTAEHNYERDGFLAKTLADEIKAPDLELNQLVSIEDVTHRVNSAVSEGMDAAAAGEARLAEISRIEKESTEQTGLRSDVITLYGGGRYHLYRFKKYTDVRLVWAPEEAAAFFGGDPDNFEYPRYDLDATIFRVYEDGKPAQIDHFLRWSENGAAKDELVFVAGNPGRTSRIFTVDALKFQRDVRLPFVMDFIRRREILLTLFAQRSEENQRMASDELMGIQNSRKAYMGMIQGLQDPAFISAREQEEKSFLDQLKSNPQTARFVSAWEQVSQTQQRRAEIQGKALNLGTQLVGIAQELVQMAAEDQKPSEKRLREFRDSNRESLLQGLLSEAPIHKELEQVVLADLLARAMEIRGADDELVLKVLDGKSPQARAAELIQNTQLDQVAVRKKLAEGGQAAIDASQDPLIELAQLIDDDARHYRKIGEELDEVERQAYSQIAEATFALKGESTYPDATFSLRLSFGTVKGYEEGGKQLPAWTTMGGAFEHEAAHHAKEPWKLPKSWHENKSQIDLDTPLNFVSTCDIIGGNSGSPVVNKNLELVGLIFDGNIQSLTSNYFYSDAQSRSTSVHSSAIREALAKIYGADRIVQELGR